MTVRGTRACVQGSKARAYRRSWYDGGETLPILELVEGVGGQLGEEFRSGCQCRLVDVEARVVEAPLLRGVRERRPQPEIGTGVFQQEASEILSAEGGLYLGRRVLAE